MTHADARVVSLTKAGTADSREIHAMQIAGFAALLEKYSDMATSPGAETPEQVEMQLAHDALDHYFMVMGGKNIGFLRIRRLGDGVCRLSRILVLPEHRNNGYAQKAMRQTEILYPEAKKWILDTIRQENALCHLYEKMGYTQTGAVRNIQPGMDLVDYAKVLSNAKR